MTYFSPMRAVPVRFNLDIELYAFAMFAAPHGGYKRAESYIASLLAGAMSNVTGGRVPPMQDAMPGGETDDIMADDRGLVRVSVPVLPAHLDHARRHFAADGFFSAEDFLQGVLNAALIEAMTAHDDAAPVGANWRPLWLREYLASLGGAWDGDEPPRDSDDFDADLPF